jgi:hypothetical protein
VIGLPGEESRGRLEDLTLLLKATVLAPQAPELLALLAVRPSARPASTSPWRRQLRSVCSDTPSSTATCFSDVPDRISSTA